MAQNVWNLRSEDQDWNLAEMLIYFISLNVKWAMLSIIPTAQSICEASVNTAWRKTVNMTTEDTDKVAEQKLLLPHPTSLLHPCISSQKIPPPKEAIYFLSENLETSEFTGSLSWAWWCLVTKSCFTLVTPWTVAHQAPLSMGFPRQEYWSVLPFPSLKDLPNPGIKPQSPAL